MIGRIQCYLPAVGRGILRTESGEEFSFHASAELASLHGGDIVEFELVGDGRPTVSGVRLRHRWAEVLNKEHRPLVNQFHQTVRIDT